MRQARREILRLRMTCSKELIECLIEQATKNKRLRLAYARNYRKARTVAENQLFLNRTNGYNSHFENDEADRELSEVLVKACDLFFRRQTPKTNRKKP